MTFAAIALCLLGAAPQEPDVSVTIYTAPQRSNYWTYYYGYSQAPATGYALVRERRTVHLAAGRNEVRIEDLPAGIDPATVHARSLTDPDGTRFLEQDYEYDLVSTDRLLERNRGRGITLMMKGGGTVEGTLVQFDAATLTVSQNDVISVVSRSEVERFNVGGAGGTLAARPRIRWAIETAREGDHTVELTYETSGVRWEATYTFLLGENDQSMDVSGWVTVDNGTDHAFPQARLRLVSGEIHRAPQTQAQWQQDQMYALRAMSEDAAAGAGASAMQPFAVQSFFDYHVYTLDWMTDLEGRAQKQVELMRPVTGVRCRKVYVLENAAGWWYQQQQYGQRPEQRATIYLEADNDEESGLGRILPAGRVRVLKRDASGAVEFVGEDAIDHTPEGELVRVQLGEATDLVGERQQTEMRQENHLTRVGWRIRVSNHKETAETVLVREQVQQWGGNWRVVTENLEHESVGTQIIQWAVALQPGETRNVEYTVEYRY